MFQFKFHVCCFVYCCISFLGFSQSIKIDTGKFHVSPYEFSKTIKSINKKVVDLTSFSVLFSSKQFTDIYMHPALYLDNVIYYLQYDAGSDEQRLIALLSMNKKDLQQNIVFLKRCNELYKKRLLKDNELIYVIFPPESNNREIIKNYKLAKVRNALLAVKNNVNASTSIKKTIDNVLSGKAYQEQKAYFNGNGVKI
jgi:hypothetical protein